MKRILVTGNEGLLGEAVMDALAAHPDFVPIPFRTLDHPRNILSAHDCQEALEGVDGVIHLASRQQCREGEDEQFFQVNAEGTKLLRKSALEKGLYPFIYASSQDIYDLTVLPGNGFAETSPIAPVSVYAKSKWRGECYLKDLDPKGLLTVRLSVLVGKRVAPKSFFSFLLEYIKERRAIEMFGQGARVYDFISVRDAAGLFVQGLDKQMEGVFNFGSGKKITVAQIAEVLADLGGVGIRFAQDRPEKPGFFLDCRKIESRFAVVRTPYQDILKELYQG
jgi:nucleoside-diphosphate-sugar epimerase